MGVKERKEERNQEKRKCVSVYMTVLVRCDSVGSVIDNCTSFQSPNLETRTEAAGERETGRRERLGSVRVCRWGHLNQQLGTSEGGLG